MLRNTLQECINVFNTNPMYQCAAIRGIEELGEWAIAATYWERLGRKTDADACRLIIKSTELGDRYRSLVKPLMDWVNETVENEIMNLEQALRVVNSQMNEAYKSVYC